MPVEWWIKYIEGESILGRGNSLRKKRGGGDGEGEHGRIKGTEVESFLAHVCLKQAKWPCQVYPANQCYTLKFCVGREHASRSINLCWKNRRWPKRDQNPGFLNLFSVLGNLLTLRSLGQFQIGLGQGATVILWFVIRNIYLVFIPIFGTELLKSLEFSKL